MKTILFDLDGTLIDHFKAIHISINFAQERLGLPLSSYELVRTTVGGSLVVTLARLLGEEYVDSATPLFNQRFVEVMLEEVEILEGASELLQALKQQCYQLAVFTNKVGDHARATLTHLGMADQLDAIVGTVDTPYRKPQIEFTEHIMNALKATPETTVLIGDSPFDYEAAAVLNLKSYLVATGSHTMEQLKAETQADGIYESLGELAQAVFDLDLGQ